MGRNWAGRAAESLFTVLFPSDCRICNTALTNISRLPVCEACLDQILPLGGDVCSICGERVLSMYAATDGEFCCPLCRQTPPPFARAAAYGSYETGMRSLIHLLKFGGVRPAADVLGRMLAPAIAAVNPGAGQGMVPVIPVPLHKNKLRQRGFNQSELIAQAALENLPVTRKLVLLNDVLVRRRETKSQIGLTDHQRRENLRGAFGVIQADKIKGLEVLLVDDVYTTGTTASECARVLRRAGATKVWVATVARTLKTASQYVERKPPAGAVETNAQGVSPARAEAS